MRASRSPAAALAAAVVLSAFLAGAPGPAAGGQDSAKPAGAVQPVSWDGWLAAKANAEKHDAAGNLVAALQYYLEYVRQARGLENPVRVAWGLNNAAFMIIKMFRQDPTVDLAPAAKLLEDGLAVAGATEDCRKRLAQNLDYVRSRLGAGR
ncbi:MAG TPA: hypothetical protein P5119_11180 [Candidatus Aminicenantes bacterium]|nr:hypothetical protein [Candidatus Aminicenantes bacterium]HRY65887.1 hypothetical protein [Candidatus Aminicenantes bacterium]HRZ72787.1 hypothetical protein [Candidatus Aminicenantes bacterium]